MMLTRDSICLELVKTLMRLFVCSAGTILLFVATGAFLCYQAMPVDLEPLNDPVFHVPLPRLFWIVCGVGMVVGMICLMTHKTKVQLTLVALCALTFLGCRTWVSLSGISLGFAGYLAGLGRVFGIGGGNMEKILCAASVYLLAGCIASLFLKRKIEVNNGIARAGKSNGAK